MLICNPIHLLTPLMTLIHTHFTYIRSHQKFAVVPVVVLRPPASDPSLTALSSISRGDEAVVAEYLEYRLE